MAKQICEICEKPMPGPPSEWPDFPFCSPRCRKIDLGRWLGEKYKIASKQNEDQSSDEDLEED
ncbi:DNA gyrase inhibitor YacG [Telmatocola sphagniphila]|uniref:DNA gyrase inhibitor YacG n=1 Tax=Telmatocola sphagniphila TaxID=1123043 RepID=A0A8E6B620_9BACT|nr:DNA gyrase inhibitor YacG [Telmatocola sphagniphila]QVL32562.1 DNA gyrase inhibitor YacG [Telmatocola sphagniphila]